MSHDRFRVIILLLVLILLAASILFGVLTYWLDASALLNLSPGERGMSPAERGGQAQKASSPESRLEGGP